MNFPVNTTILCDICSKAIFTFATDAKLGDSVTPSMLIPIHPQNKPKKAMKEKCTYCKARVSFQKFKLPDGQILTYRMGELIENL
jgi:hypothetical protein